MMITNKFKLDLQKPGTIPTIHAVQNDSYSRNLEIALYADRMPFVFPETGRVVIRYKKSDGKGGEYDTLPDGRCAWRNEGNLLTIALAPQVLTTPGSVSVSVTLIDGEAQLSVFPIRLAVEPIAAAKQAVSENYFYVTGLLSAPDSGAVGQCLRICAINEVGRVTALEAVAPDLLFGEHISREVADALEAAKTSGVFDGETPQRGIDYWTETDREELINDVLAALGTPVFGSVDADNNIILTGELPEGTYTFQYEDALGNLTEIGTLTHIPEEDGTEEEDPVTLINWADLTSEEWITGARINSSGSVVEYANTYVTNFIPCKADDVIRVKALDIGYGGDGVRAQAFFYAEDKVTAIARVNPLTSSHVNSDGWVKDSTNALWTHSIGGGSYVSINGSVEDIRYCRFCGRLFDGYTVNDIIISVNQEIV